MFLMFLTAIPRHINRLLALKTIFNEFTLKSVVLLKKQRKMNMDRIEKILIADKDIEKKIMALRCEVSDVEAKILDSFLIERLEKENRELENEIKKYKDELVHLEKLNGRAQVLNVEGNSSIQNENVKGSTPPKPSEKSPKSDIVKEPLQESEPKKTKKDAKKGDKVDNKKNANAETKKTGNSIEEFPVDIGRLDLKVGKILHIEKHPDADSLYVEKVDIGKEEPITVVSGLVKHISAADMLNSLVIILCNLKPAKMRGVTSEGMVMCASTEGVVEVLRPPAGAVPGDVVLCSGYKSNPDAILNPKKKIFETVAPDLKTDDETFATYKGARWTVGDKGYVKAKTLKGANIK